MYVPATELAGRTKVVHRNVQGERKMVLQVCRPLVMKGFKGKGQPFGLDPVTNWQLINGCQNRNNVPPPADYHWLVWYRLAFSLSQAPHSGTIECLVIVLMGDICTWRIFLLWG